MLLIAPALWSLHISIQKTDYAPIEKPGKGSTSVNAPRTEDKKTRVSSEHNE